MPLPIAAGLIASHITAIGPAPLDRLIIPLDTGFTVLIGPNGAGKSTVLRVIRSALTGCRPSAGVIRMHCRLSEDTPDSEYNIALAGLVASALQDDPDKETWAHLIGPMVSDPFGEAPEFNELIMYLGRRLTKLAETRHPRVIGDPGNVYVTLQPSGTADSPVWETYVSTRLAAPIVADGVLREAEAGPRSGQDDPLVVDLEALVAAGLDVTSDVVRVVSLAPLRGSLTLAHPVVLDDEIDVNQRTQDLLVRYAGSVGLMESIESTWDDWTYSLSEDPHDFVEHVEATAAAILEAFLGDLITDVRLRFNHPNLWPTLPVAEWVATDRYNTEVDVDQLGSGARRWARLAISAALSTVDGWTAFLLIDEPEAALHPNAQRRVASAFTDAGLVGRDIHRNQVVGGVIASHSPEFLSPGPARRRVGRDARGHTFIADIDNTVLRSAAEVLGLNESDVLQLLRTIILVEGPHDMEVFTQVFGHEIEKANAVIEPMFGAKKVLASLELRLLFEMTDVRVRVVIDSIGARASELWTTAARLEPDDEAGARRALNELRTIPGGEPKWLADAGDVLAGRGWLSRIEVVGLERPDIIDYLPVRMFVPDGTSWAELRRQHAERRPFTANGKPQPFKDWLTATYHSVINSESIRNAAKSIDALADLDRVIEGL